MIKVTTSDVKQITVNPFGMNEDFMKTMTKLSEVNRFEESLGDLPKRQTHASTETHTKISAEVPADRFAIREQQARDTLKEHCKWGRGQRYY